MDDVRLAVEGGSLEFPSCSHLLDDDSLAVAVQNALHDLLQVQEIFKTNF